MCEEVDDAQERIHRELGEDIPLGRLFGFVEPPLGFYLFLFGAVVAYLLLVELVKQRLYHRLDSRSEPASAREHRPRVPGTGA